jgi:hypothetical protein
MDYVIALKLFIKSFIIHKYVNYAHTILLVEIHKKSQYIYIYNLFFKFIRYINVRGRNEKIEILINIWITSRTGFF